MFPVPQQIDRIGMDLSPRHAAGCDSRMAGIFLV